MSEKTSEMRQLAARPAALEVIGTTLGRARCLQASQLSRMRHSLSTHGQLTPVIVVEREGKLELVDGFKRRAAAAQMAWTDLMVSARSLDERAQWAAMLTLNRAPGAFSMLEEALVLRELRDSGLTQQAIAQLLGRHKSWVCRRLGLVERLHSELVEWVRTGLMPAGTARRLMVLPPGNQLEMAAVVSRAELSTSETELLVSLWRQTSDPTIRRFLLADPHTALQKAQPERAQAAADPRLSPRAKTLARTLPLLRGVALRVSEALHPLPQPEDLEILAPEIDRTARVLPEVTRVLGFAGRSASSTNSDAPSVMPSSDDSSARETASRPLPERPGST